MARKEVGQAAPEIATKADALYRGEWGEGDIFHTPEKMPDNWVVFHSVPVAHFPTKEKENANGLDFIIPADVPAADFHPGFTTASYYVAVTRALYGLYIVPSE